MGNQTISVLAMGGTIATTPQPGGPRTGRTARDILGSVDIPDVLIRARDVRAKSSRAIDPDDMWALALAVTEEIESGVDGVVITHGTDTMEETAYALALLVDTRVPGVLTGAMRAAHLPGSDIAANLTDAVAAACHPPLADYGPVVVLHDEIHAARLVTKYHSARLAAFASPAAGPVGFLLEGTVQLLLGPPPQRDLLPVSAAPDRRVAVVTGVSGSTGAELAVLASDIDGVVLAGTGGGHATPDLAEAVGKLAHAGMPVVLASRCVDGPVLSSSYGGVGSEIELLAAGLLRTVTLSPVKARLRLLFGLSAGLSGVDLFDGKSI